VQAVDTWHEGVAMEAGGARGLEKKRLKRWYRLSDSVHKEKGNGWDEERRLCFRGGSANDVGGAASVVRPCGHRGASLQKER